MDTIALQLVKLETCTICIQLVDQEIGDPVTHFHSTADAIYRAYIRQIGAGAVATGGLA